MVPCAPSCYLHAREAYYALPHDANSASGVHPSKADRHLQNLTAATHVHFTRTAAEWQHARLATPAGSVNLVSFGYSSRHKLLFKPPSCREWARVHLCRGWTGTTLHCVR